jgi:hypothetical protein
MPLAAAAVFKEMASRADAALVKKIGCTYRFVSVSVCTHECESDC